MLGAWSLFSAGWGALRARPALAAALAIVAGGVLVYLIGRSDGLSYAEAERLEAALRAAKTWKGEAANVEAMDRVDLCVEFGGERLRCEQRLLAGEAAPRE